MIKVVPQAKPASAPVQIAEPAAERTVTLSIQIVDNGELKVEFWTVPSSLALAVTSESKDFLDRAAKCIAAGRKPGRPGTRLIVTAVNKSDPDFESGGGDDALDLGEVITIPDVVTFLHKPGTRKCSWNHIDYYLKNDQPFEMAGYAFRTFDSVKKQLLGPAKRDLAALVDAHIAWAEANNSVPFE